MNKIRMIATDLDFTLLNEHFELSETTKAILSRILDAGVELVPCSSRPLAEIPAWLRQQKQIHYLITSNGAEIFDNETGQMLKSSMLTLDKTKEIIQSAEPINPYWSCSIDGHLHSHLAILDDRKLLHIDGSYLDNILKNRIWEAGVQSLDQFRNQGTAKIHFITSIGYPQKKEELIERLSVLSGFVISSSYRYNIEIAHPDANKGAALQWLMDTLHCTAEETMACGDNHNDLPMLKAAGHSAAVANATEEVLAAVRYHAPSHTEDGAARIMEQLVFGK